jgi:hypothetical protein
MLNTILNQLVKETESLAGEIGAKDAFDKKLELLRTMKELGLETATATGSEVVQSFNYDEKVLEVVKLLVKEMQNMEKTILAMHNNIEQLKQQQVSVDLSEVTKTQDDILAKLDVLESKIGTPVEFQLPESTIEVKEDDTVQEVTVYTKADFEAEMGYPVSDEAFLEYLEIQKQWKDSFKGLCPEPKEWIPGENGEGYPAPEGFIIPLYVLENPCYEGYYVNLLKQQNESEEEKALREAEEDAAKIEETVVVPDEENEVEVDTTEPVEEEPEETYEDYGTTEEEVMANIDDDVIVKEEEPEEDNQQYINEDGEDVTDKVKLLKQMNSDLSEEDYIELATDWLTYLPDTQVLDKFNFIPNTEKDVITAKIYIEFYANERGDQAVQDEINYWSQNVNEEGLYIEEERFYDFLNENNIEAFTEHLFNVFEE